MSDREIDLAWAAGLFEGEGSFMTAQSPNGQRRMYLRMAMTSTDLDVLEKFLAVVGCGAIDGPYEKSKYSGASPNCKPQWKWRAAGAQVHKLMEDHDFSRHFCSRRRSKVDEILDVVYAQAPIVPMDHCKRGHKFTEETTCWSISKDGTRYRRCRECRRIKEKQYTARDNRVKDAEQRVGR